MSDLSHPKPTDSELEILQVLWEHGPSTVRFVNDQLNSRKQGETGYTTTLKLMQIMAEKGLVRRDTGQKVHVYEAAVREDATQQQLLRDFVDATFRGSALKLVMQALGNHDSTPEELDEIKALINKLEQANDG